MITTYALPKLIAIGFAAADNCNFHRKSNAVMFFVWCGIPIQLFFRDFPPPPRILYVRPCRSLRSRQRRMWCVYHTYDKSRIAVYAITSPLQNAPHTADTNQYCHHIQIDMYIYQLYIYNIVHVNVQWPAMPTALTSQHIHLHFQSAIRRPEPKQSTTARHFFQPVFLCCVLFRCVDALVAGAVQLPCPQGRE